MATGSPSFAANNPSGAVSVRDESHIAARHLSGSHVPQEMVMTLSRGAAIGWELLLCFPGKKKGAGISRRLIWRASAGSEMLTDRLNDASAEEERQRQQAQKVSTKHHDRGSLGRVDQEFLRCAVTRWV